MMKKQTLLEFAFFILNNSKEWCGVVKIRTSVPKPCYS